MRRARFPQVKSFEGYDYSQVAFPRRLQAGRPPSRSPSWTPPGASCSTAGPGGADPPRDGDGRAEPSRWVARCWFHSTARLVMQLERARADGKLDGALRGRHQRRPRDHGRVRLRPDPRRRRLGCSPGGVGLLREGKPRHHDQHRVREVGHGLGDDKLAAAIVDRVVHHSRLVEFSRTSTAWTGRSCSLVTGS